MYYPYVRGRQYELLALRELLLKDLLSEKIVPIIEPVKLSSTFIKTLETFIEKDREICIIYNPNVGVFNSDIKDSEKVDIKDRFIEITKNLNVKKAHIVGNNSIKVLEYWNNVYNTTNMDWVVINNNREYLSIYSEIYNSKYPVLSFIPDESSFRRSSRKNRALLEDRFGKMPRNSDYLENVDEFFSEDHLYYIEDGFEAFSDYSIVGSDYFDNGFAPYAIAIHILYFDPDKKLRVRHFVSDTNNGIQNPAGKFYEAITKLSRWVKEYRIKRTYSLGVFLEHYDNQTYPGLGTVKKLSLMHHLELIASYLDEEE